MDILSRLPIQTLVTCRCVCKDWTRLFREPYFNKLHLAASPFHLLNREPWQHGIFEPWQHVIFELGQIMEDKCTGDVDMRIVKLLNLNFHERCKYVCVDSCNGLLCLMSSSRRSVYVCNPIIGEWVSIFTPISILSMALVFSAKSNQYKLLHGFKTAAEDYGFGIYTLGGDRQWRSIDETLGCRPWSGVICYKNFNTFLHGSLHWINHKQDSICCFDVESEKFRRLSLPSRREGKKSSVYLGVINGWLCGIFSSRTRDSSPVEIWAMKEYGVEKSWTFHVCIGDI